MYAFAGVRAGKLYTREFNQSGKEKLRVTGSFQPKFFIPCSEEKSTHISTLGRPLAEMSFESIYDAKDFLKENRESLNLHGMTKFEQQYLNEKYFSVPSEERAKYSKFLNIAIFDIEVCASGGFPDMNYPNQPVTAITIYTTNTKKYHVFALRPKEDTQGWSKDNSYFKTHDKFSHIVDDIVYHEFDTERDMLMDFLIFWRNDYPHVVSGWNTEGFDVSYLTRRMEQILGEELTQTLSPFHIINVENGHDSFGNDRVYVELYGIQHLDYLALYKKHTFENQEQYSLNHISYVELKEKKINYDEVSNLYELYCLKYQKFVDYNIKDVVLVVHIDKKLQLFNLVFDIAYLALINFEDTYSPVKTWEALMYNYLLEEKKVAPMGKHNHKGEKYEGAVVFSPKVGLHKWIVSFDATSLYPSIIRQWNMGPDTIIGDTYSVSGYHMRDVTPERFLNEEIDISAAVSNNVALAANGACFDKTKWSIAAKMMKMVFDGRTEAKDKAKQLKKEYEKTKDEELKSLISMYNTRQLALKVLLNSFYGACGNQYFSMYDLRIAEGITLTAQFIIQWAQKSVNEYLNKILKTNKDYIIAGDTDSIYFTLDPLVKKVYGNSNVGVAQVVEFCDKVCKQIENDCLKPAYEKLFGMSNAYENVISFKREAISDVGFWVAKKKYALRVYDMEGVRYSEPSVKVTGLEIVKKDYPEVSRNALYDSVVIILDGDKTKLKSFIDSFRKQFEEFDLLQIGVPKGVSNIAKYQNGDSYVSGTPFNSKAAINYNVLLARHGLGSKYNKINEGDKPYIIYLKTPNPLRDDIISFPDMLPPEFGLHKYVNYDKHFENTFMSPLTNITTAIGWDISGKATLDDFF